MKGMKQFAVCAAVLLLGLTGCQKAGETLPDLSGLGEVIAVSREEGSGTRDQFELLVNTQESGADDVALSTEEMKKKVATSKNAIGYVAYSTLKEDDRVKALSVNGIQPEEQSIQTEKYPLCRRYSLAWKGELRPVEQDFLTYISTAGQELVAQSCIPVSENKTFLSDESGGSITICGSSSAAPLVTQLAKQYEKENPNADIVVTATDSTDGLTAAIQGDCDLAMSSRDLQSYETELLETQSIALDGIAVIVPTDSPLESLTTEQLQTIFDGEVSRWEELN